MISMVRMWMKWAIAVSVAIRLGAYDLLERLIDLALVYALVSQRAVIR